MSNADISQQSNILMENGKALLIDFGLSTVKAEFRSSAFISSTIAGSVRWMAPELIRSDDRAHATSVNKETDVYAFGSVSLHVRITVFIITRADNVSR